MLPTLRENIKNLTIARAKTLGIVGMVIQGTIRVAILKVVRVTTPRDS